MKILQVVPYFNPAFMFGGPVTVSHQLSRELVRRKHEVVVYSSDAKDLTTRLNLESPSMLDGIKVYYFKNISMKPVEWLKLFITPGLIWKVKKELKEFDIIHLHEYYSFQNIVVAHYASKYGIPYVIQAHGSLSSVGAHRRLKLIYNKFLGYRLLRRASKVIALNQTEAQQAKDMGVLEEKIEIIPNGIDLSDYAELPPKGSFRKKFNISMDEKIVLYLGRLHESKGLDLLIKAYSYLVKEMKCTDTLLVIAGPDDGYLTKMETLIKELNIENNILIVGPLYGIKKYEAYIDSEIYVLPSRFETFPMTLLEAYACKKPVIITRIENLKDLVIDKQTGLVSNYGDEVDLAKNIFNLLTDSEKRKIMGLNGRKLIENNFTVEKMVEKLEYIYKYLYMVNIKK